MLRVLVLALVVAACGSDSPTVALDQSTVELDMTTGIVANGVDAATLTVTLRDAGGSPIAGRAIEVISPDEVTIGFTPRTDAHGISETSLSTTVAGTKQINVTVDDRSFETITVEFLPGASTNLVFLDLIGPTEVSATLPSFRVAFADAFDNVVTTATGTIALTLSPNDSSLIGTTSVAAIDGVATFDSLSITTAATGLVLQASSAGASPRDSEPFDVVLGEPSATTSTFVASPVAVAADGIEEAELVVTLRNAGGIAIPNYPVTFAATGNGKVFYPAMSGTTDAQGQLRTQLSSSDVGVSNVTASAGARIFSATVTFEASCIPQLPAGPSAVVDETSAFAMVAADFTGDGQRDVIVLNQSSGIDFISVLRGAGNGRFHAAVTYAVGDDARSLSQGDMDGDGDLDVVVAGAFDKKIHVLLNEGHGTFVAGSAVPFAHSIFDVKVVDFNGDAKADLVTRGDYIVTTLAGNGDGTFQAGTEYTLDVDHFSDPSAMLEIAKIDGNATFDIFTIGNNKYTVLLGNPNGTFSMLPSVDGVGPTPQLGLGDLDNDGFLDVVNGLLVYFGKGDGTFDTAVNIGPTLVYGVTARVVDFDQDGNEDLIAGVTQPGMREVWLYTGTGTRAFDDTPQKVTLGRGVNALAVGDFDGDVDPDVLVLQSFNGSTLALLHGLGVVAVRGGAVRYGDTVGPQRASFWPSVGDFDGSGTLDFVADNMVTFNLGIQLRASNGALTAMPTHSFGTKSDVTSGDFNGDGALDVLVLGGGALHWLRGEGNGLLQAPVTSTVPAGSGLRVAQFDAGSTDDVVYVDSFSNVVIVAFGTGTGTWANPIQLPVATEPREVRVTDIEGDGDQDLVVASNAGKAVTVFVNNGGAFTAKPALVSTGSPAAIAIGDVDGDSKLDIIAGDAFALSVGFFHGNGDGTFATEVRIPTSVPTWRVELHDLDADGELDLLASFGGLHVFRGAAGATFLPPLLYDTGFFGTTFVDYNGDSRLDVMGTHVGQSEPGVTVALARPCQ